MKRLFIMPFFVLFMTGAASNRVEPRPQSNQSIINSSVPISVKVDSINVRAQELSNLIKKL